MKAISNIIFKKSLSNLKNHNITKFFFSRLLIKNNLINKKTLSFIQYPKQFFSGCNKESCGCHSGEKQEDELEKKLKSINQRVIQCINLGQFDDALELSDEYISQIKTNFGDEHPFYCSAVNNKAFILKTCGHYDEARVLFEEVIFKYKKIYGEHNDKVVITKQNLATLYRDNKQIDQAIEIFEQLIEDIQSFKTDVKPNVMANIYNSVSGCYRINKNFDDALDCLNKAYNLIKENYGEKNLPIATIFNNRGMNYKDQGKFQEALESYQKALEIRKELLPEDHPDVMAITHNIGQLYFDFGDNDNAQKYFNANIEIMNKKQNAQKEKEKKQENQ